GPTGNRLASVGDTAFRAARSDYRDWGRKAPLPLCAGYCKGAASAAPFFVQPRGLESGPVGCSGSDSLGSRDGFRGESGQVQPELFENLSVEETALRVEALVGARHRDLRPDDARAGDAEDA